MSELISREALDAEMQKAQEILESNSDQVWGLNKGHHAGLAWARRLCADAPVVDAAPVVHARWVKAHGMMPPEYHHRKQCDMCGGWALQDYFGRERLSHYCPACGAKMDGGAE